MSVLEMLLLLQLIRLYASYVIGLRTGIEDFLGSLRNEYPDAFGCDPDGDRWIVYKMPPNWEEELEELSRRVDEKLEMRRRGT